MSKLEFNHYGNHMVRLLRVNKNGPAHEVSEWEADVLLEGDLAGSYLSEDNSSVVPTDTVKNAVLALAHDREDATRDAFALALASHFIEGYSHLTAADGEVREKLWTRLAPAGNPHPHAFVREANGQPFSFVRVERRKPVRRAAGIHYLNIDLTKVGRPAGQKKVFLPTSDPFGSIEAVVAR